MTHSVFGTFPSLISNLAKDVISTAEEVVRDTAEEVVHDVETAVHHSEKRVELWVEDETGTLRKHETSPVAADGSYHLKAPKADGLHLKKNGKKVRPSEAFPKLAARFGLASIEHQVALAGEAIAEDASKELADARDYIDALVREAATHEPAAEEWTKDSPHETHGTAELRFVHSDKEVHRRKLLLSPFDEVVHEPVADPSFHNELDHAFGVAAAA